jgi:hypothetical protein
MYFLYIRNVLLLTLLSFFIRTFGRRAVGNAGATNLRSVIIGETDALPPLLVSLVLLVSPPAAIRTYGGITYTSMIF